MAINPVTASKIEHLMKARADYYSDVQRLRDYANGDTPVYLTDDQKIQLVGEDSAGNPNSDPEFALNICDTVLGVENDRLEVQDITITVPDNEDLSSTLSAWVWKIWKRNRLDEGQQHAHYSACRDRDSFAICHYDQDEKYPKLAVHQAYDGQSGGADIYYIDDDPMQPECAIKIWIERDDEAAKIRRKNVYYSDRVEKWISEGGVSSAYADANWRPLRYADKDFTNDLVMVPSLSQPEREAAVVWWTETGSAANYDEHGKFVSGSPGMGIPVKHFRHDARGGAYGNSTIDPLVPGVQDAINRAALDVQAASVLAGFPANFIIGANRDETTWTVGPSEVLVVEDPGGSAGQFPAANLAQLVEVKDTWIKDAATLTATPLTYFNLSGVIPAEGTQQSLEMALLAKVKRDQISFGNTWEDIIRMWLKMELTWGTELKGLTPEMLDDIEIDCVWADAKVKNEREQYEIAEKMKALGIPQRFILRFLDYSEDEIDQMEEETDAKRAQFAGEAALAIIQAEQDAENQQAQQPVAAGGGNGANSAANQRATQ